MQHSIEMQRFSQFPVLESNILAIRLTDSSCFLSNHADYQGSWCGAAGDWSNIFLEVRSNRGSNMHTPNPPTNGGMTFGA